MKKRSPDDQIDFGHHIARIFPMKDHVLYGSPSSFRDCDYLQPAQLAEYTAARAEEPATCAVTTLEICPACFFQTSGTTSRTKQIPFSDDDLGRQKQHEAIALRKLGLKPSDAVLSLGAPLPSISGWAIVNGSGAVGAEVLNSSQLDFDDVVRDPDKARRATTVIGTPLVVKAIGEEIASEFGSVSEVMPNLRLAVIFGDVLPAALRRQIGKIWGIDEVYSLYGTVEADVVATECRHAIGQLELMRERLMFEVIPEGELTKERLTPGYKPKAISVDEAPHGTIGEILISDVARDILPILRYRIGDVIKISRGTDPENPQLPTISVLGRSKNTVYFGDVPVYEMQINGAVSSVLGESLKEWRLVQEAGHAKYKLLLETPGQHNERAGAQIVEALVTERSELSDIDLNGRLDIRIVDELPTALVKGDAKAKRIQLLGA